MCDILSNAKCQGRKAAPTTALAAMAVDKTWQNSAAIKKQVGKKRKERRKNGAIWRVNKFIFPNVLYSGCRFSFSHCLLCPLSLFSCAMLNENVFSRAHLLRSVVVLYIFFVGPPSLTMTTMADEDDLVVIFIWLLHIQSESFRVRLLSIHTVISSTSQFHSSRHRHGSPDATIIVHDYYQTAHRRIICTHIVYCRLESTECPAMPNAVYTVYTEDRMPFMRWPKGFNTINEQFSFNAEYYCTHTHTHARSHTRTDDNRGEASIHLRQPI